RHKTLVGMAEPKRELSEFLEMLDRYRARLGTVHIDKIENAPMYLTTDKTGRGLGHLLMIEQVHLYKNNPLFNEVGTEIVDTPGTDSTNERQRELTYRYLAESDAIMLVLEPRGISMAGRNIWEELGKYNRSIRNKMFFLMNKFDTLGTQDLRKDQLEKLLVSQVIEKLSMYNLDPNKLFLTCAKIVDLENRKAQRKATPQEMAEMESMYKDFQAKREALDPAVRADLKPLINQALTDGALANLRKKLIDYLRWDIQVERLGEVYADLNHVLEATKKMMASEESVLEELRKKAKTQSEEIVEFFENVKNAFFDALSVIPKGVEKAVNVGIGRAKGELQTRITAAIDRYNFQRILMRMAVVNVQEVKLQVINQFKTELSARFAEVIKGAVAPLIVDKLKEQVRASRVDQVVRAISGELKTDHGQRFDELVRLFCSNMEQFTYLRALESTWKLQDADMRPAGFEPSWTDQVEKDFREDLKSVFVGPLVDEAVALEPILARHYRALVMDMLDRFEKLIDELWTEVKKDPDRVKLPVALLTGVSEASEEEQIKVALLKYDAMLKTATDLDARVPKEIKMVSQR
ncbi:MAG: dynamin family protein, partial [Planctomycetota bacterium]|nr:dynamin family protein [Planctomycetota bacterium]